MNGAGDAEGAVDVGTTYYYRAQTQRLKLEAPGSHRPFQLEARTYKNQDVGGYGNTTSSE